MITVVCRRCGEDLEEPGGLLFAPPIDPRLTSTHTCIKSHLCVTCWEWLEELLPQ